MPNGTAPRRRATTRKNAIPVPKPNRLHHDEIARRAFEIFLGRGGGHGHDMDDWLQAEQEIRTRAARKES